MVALASLTDFANMTGPTINRTEDEILQEACFHAYSYGALLAGKGKESVFSGGSELREILLMTDAGTSQDYGVGQPFNYNTAQLSVKVRADWRYRTANTSYHDQEMILNGPSKMTGANRFQTFKRFWTKIQKQLWTDVWNGLEGVPWAVPSTTNMESTNGLAPYSIPCFVNEAPNGLFNNQTGDVWTTVEGLANNVPLSQRWRNHVEAYSDTIPFAPTAGPTTTTYNTIVQGLDDAFADAKFDQPVGPHGEQFENDDLAQQMVFTTKKGINEYKKLIRLSNDHFTSNGNDAALPGGAIYQGHKMYRVDKLESTALYRNVAGNALVTEGDTNALGRGPRFYVINSKYLHPMVHDERKFYITPLITPANQPFSHTLVFDHYHQIWCISRQRQVIVSPGAVTGTFPSQTYTPAQVFAAY